MIWKSGPLAKFVLFVLLLTAAEARLGETEQELQHRYGDALSRQIAKKSAQGRTYNYGEYLHFRSDDWGIAVLLIDKRCEEVTYTKRGDWSEEQIKHILELNGGRSQWEEQKMPSGFATRVWKRRDKTVATLRGGLGLEVKTPVVEQSREAIEKAAKEEASKLPKF